MKWEFFWKKKVSLEKVPWFYSMILFEAAKAFVPYFEVLQDGFVKRPCDANLVFCSWVLDVRMKIIEKTEEDLLRKCL